MSAYFWDVTWRYIPQELFFSRRAIPVVFSIINPLNTKCRPLHLKTQFVPHTFHIGYKNQSVYAVSGTNRCLFSDKYETHKYSVGRTYSCWMLNCWCITWPVGFKRLRNLLNMREQHQPQRSRECRHTQKRIHVRQIVRHNKTVEEALEGP